MSFTLLESLPQVVILVIRKKLSERVTEYTSELSQGILESYLLKAFILILDLKKNLSCFNWVYVIIFIFMLSIVSFLGKVLSSCFHQSLTPSSTFFI